MKKLINAVEDIVPEMLEGLVRAHPDRLRKLEGHNVIVRKDAPVQGKVGLVSGGGSGHEPAHAGYVGPGMLDAGVAGEVFTSPTPEPVFEAIKAVNGGRGVLLVIKNYTGDVMNFEMAGEMAAAEGIEVASVVVNDDVAVQDSLYTTGRRGVAGTVFVHKIAGARAAAGGSLQEVKQAAEHVIANVRSMGMALSPCTVPAAGKPGFELGEDEIEIGIGIHGEPGVQKGKLMPASAIVDMMLDRILADIDYTGREAALMVNGMGATPLMELYVATRAAHLRLDREGVRVYRTYVGNFMTSLEMAGFSLTLLRLDDDLKKLLDAPADTPAFKQS
ncbi:MAG: dihydroxyacetone kinase subunit DhaK [Clostridia bacterium]|nr:dihydroxyacetone kinase subunit DhaK [Clostridia bacterium]